MVKKKSITTDELAVMVQNGFSELRGEMNGKFDELHNEITSVKNEIVGVKQRMGGLEKRMDIFSDHERRLVKVETKVGIAV